MPALRLVLIGSATPTPNWLPVASTVLPPLAERLSAEALVGRRRGSHRLGHAGVRLYTERSLSEAQAMYRSRGYVEIPRYNDDPYATHWFEKRLTR